MVDLIPMKITQLMLNSMTKTHLRRGISIFAGPPGIGKTTAINALVEQYPGCIAVTKVSNTRATERIVMQHMVEAVRRIGWSKSEYIYQDSYQVRNQLFEELESWALFRENGRVVGETRNDEDDTPLVTFVFDEAQNLSKVAIEALRYWNDRDRCYSPFPVGLIFVGNNEFSLKSDRSGESVISAAVRDRTLYSDTFDYTDVSNTDLALFLAAHGVEDVEVVRLIVRYFSGTRITRSLRQVMRTIHDLRDEANGAPITAEITRAVLGS